MSKNEQQMNFVDAMASRENRSNRTATRGRDPHDPLVMFKMTRLQRFYDLSDPEPSGAR